MTAPIRERARAKVNLTLRVLGRRADGMHDIESLVAFADVADGLSLSPGRPLSLVVTGRVAREVPADGDNLVLRAAAAFARLEPGTATGAFALKKRLPVAAGLGGGSADAAAALRALAILNGLAPGHPSVVGAAREVGADVPACLAGVACTMRGIGHEIEAHAIGAPIHAVLVNPGVAVATRDVFAGLGLAPGGRRARAAAPADFVGALETMAAHGNDLQAPATRVAPAIDDAIDALGATTGAAYARMSGSGATCFATFGDAAAAEVAAAGIAAAHPLWWVVATVLR